MRPLFVILLSIISFFSCSNSSIEEQPKKQAQVPFGDPYILLHDGVYYAYGTHADNGIEVMISTDLKNWKWHSSLAIHKNDSWGDRWFWAPEVYYVNGKFYMYYSADEHICVATSNSPTGPFIQDIKEPMLEDNAIDNHLFIDDNGTIYQYFVRFNDGSGKPNDGNYIWVAELENDYQTIKRQTMNLCLSVDREWENVWPKVVEGPFVVKHNGKYYMTYSANSYESQNYGIGYATADNPYGPWTKYEGNPILQKPGELVGTGHHSLFKDKDGVLKIVFHAHNSKEKIHPRLMYVSTVTFDSNGVMKIDPNYTVQYIAQ